MLFSRKYLTEILGFFALVIGILIVANLTKFGYISKNILIQNKDLIELLGSILTSLLLLIGAVASYYRFFRGRTLSVTVNLDLDVSIHETEQNFLLHVVNIECINEGSFPILGPIATLVGYPHGISSLSQYDEIDLWASELEQSFKDHIKVIHPQETEQFYAFHRVPKSVWAVTYVVQLKSQKSKWTKVITVSNRLEKS